MHPVSMKEELIIKLEELTKETVSEETFSKAEEIKNDYLRECDRLHQELQMISNRQKTHLIIASVS